MGVIRKMASCTSRQEMHCYLTSPSQQQLLASLQLTELVSTMLARKLQSNLQEQTRVTAHAIFNPADKTSQQTKSSLQNFARRYSRPQVSINEEDTFDADALLQKFNTSVKFPGSSQNRAIGDSNTNFNADSEPDPHVLQRYFDRRRRSSPDVGSLGQLRSNNLQLASKITSDSLTVAKPEGQMTKGMDKSASYSNLETAVATKNPGANLPPSLMTGKDTTDASIMADPSSRQGLGILSKTRKFGAWLTKATEGEKVEVTKKDLNAFAPTSF